MKLFPFLIALLAPLLPPADQAEAPPPRPRFPPAPGPGDPFRPGFLGPGPRLEVVERFDKDGNHRLDRPERDAARAAVSEERGRRRRPGPPPGAGASPFGPPGRGPGGPGREALAPASPGPRVSPAEVPTAGDADLYDPAVLRTLFLQFEDDDWEKELGDFYRTDVEVPATLLVDGRRYPGVGVRFRGQSSFMMVPAGHKRSLNLSLDFVDPKQSLGGARTLNLLNAHGDPTFVRTVLYHQVARAYLPAPRANFVRVVINGESWGVYVNAQQFNKDMARQIGGGGAGDRWKVPGSPGADGGLNYLGEDLAEYRRRYQIKSKDRPEAWAALVELTRVLEQTPPEKLERALRPILDLDGTLKFLALENALINSDGYWVRASDYNLYRDQAGRFHLIPHDANETFREPEGPGRPGGPLAAEAAGIELDPLAGSDNPRRPLLARLLAVPALRARYLGYLHTLARDALDWRKLGPIVRQHQALIAGEVARDTRKLSSTAAFSAAVSEDDPAPASELGPGPRRRPGLISLQSFVERRRAFLLAHPLVKRARPQTLASLR